MKSDKDELTDKELAEILENQRRIEDMLFDQLCPQDFLDKTKRKQ